MVCLPTVATAALFTAVIIYDLYDRNWSRIPGHGLFGVFATLLMLFICQRTSDWVAWSILAIPIVFCFAASFFTQTSAPVPASVPEATATLDTSSCCNSNPRGCMRPCRKPTPIPIRPKCPEPEPEPTPTPTPEPTPTPDKCCKPPKSSSSSSSSNWGHGGFYIKTTYE